MLSKLKKKLGLKRKSHKTKHRQFEFVRKEADDTLGETQAEVKLINLLNYTKTSQTSYAAIDHPAGYHTISIGGKTLQGQRNPSHRLRNVPYDFTGKTLLDVGCNQGGMVFTVSDKLHWGVGVDYDPRMVNVCNAIRSKMNVTNCDFYVHDIDKFPMGLIEDYLPCQRVDIVFLLAVCMWIDRWQELISYLAGISDHMLFETNGKPHQQDEQVAYLNSVYESVELISDISDDDDIQKNRRLYFCK